MSSMKSHINNFVNLQLLKEQLRRFGIIGAAALLAYFLGVLLPLLNESQRAGTGVERMIVNILRMQNPILMVAMVLLPFCVVMALYPYHFSGRATTAFYTFPVTKRQLFWTNFVAGSALIIVPLLIMCLFLLIPIFYTLPADIDGLRQTFRWGIWLPPTIFPEDGLLHGQVINSLWRVTAFFGRNVVGFMFFFGVFSLAVSLAGSRLISILLCAALPFVPAAIHGMIYGMSVFYLFGVHEASLAGSVSQTMVHTFPAAWNVVIDGNYARELGIWVHTVVYTAIAAVLFALAYMCSRMRKHERTGESVVFNKFKNAMVFTLSMAGMVAMGAFLMALFGGRVWWYTGFMFGFALMFVIAQMIAEKAFDIRHKLKLLIPFGAIMVGAYIVVVLILTVGMRPYVNRVPDSARVEAVAIGRQWGWHNVGPFVSDPEIIERVTEVHREILDNRAYLRRAHNNSRFNNRWGGWVTSFPIIYRMDDGSYIRRNYFLTDSFARISGARELANDPVFLFAAHHGLQNPQDIRYISIDFWGQTMGVDRAHVAVLVTLQEEILQLIPVIAAEYHAHRNPVHDIITVDEQLSVNMRIELNQNVVGRNAATQEWLHFWTCADGELMSLLREFGHID